MDKKAAPENCKDNESKQKTCMQCLSIWKCERPIEQKAAEWQLYRTGKRL